jgi:hypothetical protein
LFARIPALTVLLSIMEYAKMVVEDTLPLFVVSGQTARCVHWSVLHK